MNPNQQANRDHDKIKDEIFLGDRTFDLLMIDMAGGYKEHRLEEFEIAQIYINTDLFVFCYDCNDHKTLLKLKQYYQEVGDLLTADTYTAKDAIKILMGCKSGETSTSSGSGNSSAGYSGAVVKRKVEDLDLVALKEQKVYFDMEFTCSTLRAKDDNNVKKTMEKIFSRIVDIQERRRQYRKKKNQRVVVLRFEG